MSTPDVFLEIVRHPTPNGLYYILNVKGKTVVQMPAGGCSEDCEKTRFKLLEYGRSLLDLDPDFKRNFQG